MSLFIYTLAYVHTQTNICLLLDYHNKSYKDLHINLNVNEIAEKALYTLLTTTQAILYEETLIIHNQWVVSCYDNFCILRPHNRHCRVKLGLLNWLLISIMLWWFAWMNCLLAQYPVGNVCWWVYFVKNCCCRIYLFKFNIEFRALYINEKKMQLLFDCNQN